MRETPVQDSPASSGTQSCTFAGAVAAGPPPASDAATAATDLPVRHSVGLHASGISNGMLSMCSLHSPWLPPVLLLLLLLFPLPPLLPPSPSPQSKVNHAPARPTRPLTRSEQPGVPPVPEGQEQRMPPSHLQQQI